MKSQTFAQRLFKLVELSNREIVNFHRLASYIQSFTTRLTPHYTVTFRESRLYFCKSETRDCIVVECESGKPRIIPIGSGEVLLTFTQVLLRYLATEGVKRVVSLYRKTGEVFVKISPSGADKLLVVLSRTAQLVIVLVVTALLAVLSMYRVCIFYTVGALAVALVLMLVLLPEIIVRTVKLQPLESVYKLEVTLPEDVQDSCLSAVLKLLRSCTVLTPDQLSRLLSLVRELIGDRGEVTFREVVLSERLIALLRKCKVKLLLLSSDRPEAFSVQGLHRYVVVTTRLVATLRQDELEAVIAHEVGHLVSAHTYIVAVLLTIVCGTLLGLTQLVLSLNLDIVLLIVLLVLTGLGLLLLSWSIMRRLEFHADNYAVSVTSPESLAYALIRVGWRQAVLELERPLVMRLADLFATHPLVTDRITRVLSRYISAS